MEGLTAEADSDGVHLPLDGLLADEGTESWKFCFDLPENREPDDPAQLDFLQSAYAHIMGRTAYKGSTSSGWAATATSWSGAASASGGRSCGST